MNTAHLHLMVNHLPIVGVVGVALLLMVAHVRRSEELTRTALGLTILLALVGLGVYLTGEPAEEVLERYPGFSERAIEPHEDAAKIASIALGIVGAVSAGLLLLARGRPISSRARALMVVLTLASSALFARTATLGGQIRHPEIGGGTGQAIDADQDEIYP